MIKSRLRCTSRGKIIDYPCEWSKATKSWRKLSHPTMFFQCYTQLGISFLFMEIETKKATKSTGDMTILLDTAARCLNWHFFFQTLRETKSFSWKIVQLPICFWSRRCSACLRYGKWKSKEKYYIHERTIDDEADWIIGMSHFPRLFTAEKEEWKMVKLGRMDALFLWFVFQFQK